MGLRGREEGKEMGERKVKITVGDGNPAGTEQINVFLLQISFFNPPTWTCSPKLYLTPDAYRERKNILVTWRKVKKEGTPSRRLRPLGPRPEVIQGSALFTLGRRKRGNLPGLSSLILP